MTCSDKVARVMVRWMLLLLVLVVSSAMLVEFVQPKMFALAYAQPVELDVPGRKGTCALYETHRYASGAVSYQLTCAAPVPESVTVHLRKAQ